MSNCKLVTEKLIGAAAADPYLQKEITKKYGDKDRKTTCQKN
jgi:hypothetical protein